jgi:hypothetical protein
MHGDNVVMRSDHRTGKTLQQETESSRSDIETTRLDPDAICVWNSEIVIIEVRVCDEMFSAPLIRLEAIGETVKRGNWHALF